MRTRQIKGCNTLVIQTLTTSAKLTAGSNANNLCQIRRPDAKTRERPWKRDWLSVLLAQHVHLIGPAATRLPW